MIPVRGGLLPAGAAEAVGEAGGRALLVGEGTESAAARLDTGGGVTCIELGAFAPGAWAGALAPLLMSSRVILLPASPDGRDLAPRLAYLLGRPLLAGAISVAGDRVTLVRQGGRTLEERTAAGALVVTLIPGVRGHEPAAAAPRVETAAVLAVPGHDAEVLEVLPPDPSTADLSEAERIVAGGAGLGSAAAFEVLRRVAAAAGASHAGSRVAADLGWVAQERFIGTTGATVHPRLYLALGISGAVQHLTGLGTPEHLVAVNTDASAPIMAIADLALVTDARALLDELAVRLGAAG